MHGETVKLILDIWLNSVEWSIGSWHCLNLYRTTVKERKELYASCSAWYWKRRSESRAGKRLHNVDGAAIVSGAEVHMETQYPRFPYIGWLTKLDQLCRSSYEDPIPKSTTVVRPNLRISERQTLPII